jgi:hypothetical protein
MSWEDVMSATGLDVFDKTVQTTNVWLNEIAHELEGLRPINPEAATKAVLHTDRRH